VFWFFRKKEFFMRNYGKSVFDLEGNVVAMLCYLLNVICCLGPVFSIVVLVQDKNNKLARFHAAQSIAFFIVSFLIGLLGSLVSLALGSFGSGSIGFGLTILGFLLSLAILIPILGLAIFSSIKAYQGEFFKIPLIGDIAEKYS
jgi:uncharacterized membrane protein